MYVVIVVLVGAARPLLLILLLYIQLKYIVSCPIFLQSPPCSSHALSSLCVGVVGIGVSGVVVSSLCVVVVLKLNLKTFRTALFYI